MEKIRKTYYRFTKYMILRIVDKPLFLRPAELCMQIYCVHNVHNSTFIIFLLFRNFYIQKGAQVIIGLKLKIRI